MSKKPSKGRQRIEMKKMQKEDQLQVTFSRRRHGIMKVANEMSILTGAQIALIIFSPSKRVYPFGTPDFKPVIEKYEGENGRAVTGQGLFIRPHSRANVEALSTELTELLSQIEAEKKRGKQLDEELEKYEGQSWSEASIKKLDLNKLESMYSSMKELHENIIQELKTKFDDLSPEDKDAAVKSLFNNDNLSHVFRQVPLDFEVPMTNGFVPNAANPSATQGQDVPPAAMGGPILNQIPPFIPMTNFWPISPVMNAAGQSDANQNVAIPPAVGFPGVLQYAGPLMSNGAPAQVIYGATGSNPMVPFNLGAPMFQMFSGFPN